MTDSALIIEQLLGRARQLYSLPAVAMEVLELTNNPTVDARALKQCIENDPALTGRLLRVVNSSLFGLPREVSDLNQALALLGTKPLKLLVLGFSLPLGLFEGISAELLAHYWRHTLTKAVAGREIAETIWNTPGDEAFLAGLLQDLGVLLLIGELGEPYARLLEKTYGEGTDLARLETQAMGFDHVELSARLLESWGLPESLACAVRQRETGAMSPTQRALLRIVRLAELAARLLADGRTEALAELLALGKQYHDVSPEQIDLLVASLQEKVEQLANVLSLQMPGALDYSEILARAHRQLSEVALAAAVELAVHPADADTEAASDELASLSAAVARFAHDGLAPVGSRPKPQTTTAAAKPQAATPRQPKARPQPTGTIGLPEELLVPLEAAVAACRHSRRPLSLLLVEVGWQHGATAGGAPARDVIQPAVMAMCRALDHPYVRCLPYRELGGAVILADCDRSAAVALGNQIVRDARSRLGEVLGEVSREAHLAAGTASVALPPKNFPARDLLEAADRCLYGSHTSGGGVVKSIEIY